MSEFTEVTAENLRLVRGAHDKNQNEIADLLGVPRNAISKIESGQRSLSDTEKHLLDWYFFGKVPPRITSSSVDLRGILEFSEAEWRIINIFANRAGQTAGKWIASHVRSHLTEARRLGLIPGDKAETHLKVADDTDAANSPAVESPSIKYRGTGRKAK